jgi:hypothetical protein
MARLPDLPLCFTRNLVLLALGHRALIVRDFVEVTMRFGPFLALALLLSLLLVGGFVFFHVAGFLIHLLLIFAVISLLAHLFTGARTA